MIFNNEGKPEISSGKVSCSKWSMARLPKEGENVCADYYLVKKSEDKILIAVVDGLGHGSKAAEASRRAVEILETFGDESIINLVNRCHKNLRSTRGVVMSLGLVDCTEHTLTWIGIGNVEGILLRADSENEQFAENIILRGGVVGYKLPSLQASLVPVSNGDILIFTTDGVQRNFVKKGDTPEEIVRYTARNYFKNSDDALILAVQFVE